MSHNLIDLSHRDAHWFNTVHIPRTDIEQILGYKHLETRARNYYALGISLSALFDIPASGDFLRALIKLLEEWESFCEGSTGAKGVVSVRLYLYQHQGDADYPNRKACSGDRGRVGKLQGVDQLCRTLVLQWTVQNLFSSTSTWLVLRLTGD